MNQSLHQEIKSLLALIHPGGIGTDDDNSAKAWGFGDKGLHIKRENISKYLRCAKELYRKTCVSDYSFSHFERLLLVTFNSSIKQSTPPSNQDVTEFQQKLKQEPVREYLVTRDIYGIRFVKTRDDPLQLGPFTIYNFETHKAQLLAHGQANEELLWNNRSPVYLIGVRVRSKHKERAIEKADELFDKFEKFIRFMIGPTSDYDAKILQAYGRYEKNAYVFSENSFSSGSYSWDGPYQQIDIDDEYFVSQKLGYDRLWSSLNSEHVKPLQAKIAMASMWLGQAYAEKSTPAAFIKAAISLEVLFTVNEKSLINPSILSQISETIASILGKDADNRLEIEKSLKKYYGIRSAVAHAGKLDIADEDLNDFIQLARAALMKILRTAELSTLDTPELLNAHIKKLRYSFKEI